MKPSDGTAEQPVSDLIPWDYRNILTCDTAHKFPKAQERLEELKRGGVRAQRSRERLSRSNHKQHEENCVVM